MTLPVLGTMLVSALAAAGPAVMAGDLGFRLNGRAVSLPLSSPVIIDETPATAADLPLWPDGLRVSWTTNALGIQGAAPVPVFSYTLIGPVTRRNPLEILGQAVTATADTVLVNASLPLDAPLGTAFVVAGLVDTNGSVLASLVERRGVGGNRFLFTGPVTAVQAGSSTLAVGNQWLSYAGAAWGTCGQTPPPPGSIVSVRATGVPELPPGSVLGGVQNIDCVSLVPAGTPGAGGFIQGLVTAVDAAGFQLGALGVRTGPTTQYVFGAADDLGEGVAVSVEGTYAQSLLFDATAVEFVRPVVRYTAPLTPAQVSAGQWLRPFDVEVRVTAQLRDEDGIAANGLAAARQVEVRGYLDANGRAHATRVRDRGNADPTDVRLRGPVSAITPPRLTIQGLVVDTTGATFSDEIGNLMSAQQFFAAVMLDHEVDASGATWNPATRTLTGGAIIWIGGEPIANPPLTASIRAGTATGYSRPDLIHADGFEG